MRTISIFAAIAAALAVSLAACSNQPDMTDGSPSAAPPSSFSAGEEPTEPDGEAESAAETDEDAAAQPEQQEKPTAIEAEGADQQSGSAPSGGKPEPAQAAEPPPSSPSTPAQATPPPAKYSVIGPDGATYTGSEPVFIICRCGEQFGTGGEWQAHRDCHSAFRCSCGAVFSGVGEWEAHAGIYDPATYLYTGKTREHASHEGHTPTNESGHAEEYNSHNGWRTTGFPAF
ncbi:MAG: hypothetical protein LBS91_00930 [Clostridiales Family XIII bacterium]|nr:hypothetical protein [Clostridiales Family XIII bacterium]